MTDREFDQHMKALAKYRIKTAEEVEEREAQRSIDRFDAHYLFESHANHAEQLAGLGAVMA